MRIGIDAKLMTVGWGGAPRYIMQLLKGLAEIDEENEYYIYLDRIWPRTWHEELKFIKSRPNFHIRAPNKLKNFIEILYAHCPFVFSVLYRFGLYEQLLLPFYLKKDKVNLFHSAQNALPFAYVGKSILTIFYMTPSLHQESLRNLNGRLFNYIHKILTPLFVSKSDMIIAHGETVKKEILMTYKHAKKIRVITPGLSETFKIIPNQDKIEEIKAKYGIQSSYIFCLDSAAFHNEYISIIEAYYRLKKEKNIQPKLVIGGLSQINNQDFIKYLESFIQDKNLGNEVILLGYIPENDLALIYNGAELFIYPSTHEGFGIIPIEAMACGTPVIAVTSTSPMIYEMVGDAAIIIDLQNIDTLVDSIYIMLNDEKLRSMMKDRGLRWAEKFDWRSIARKTLEVYKDIGDEIKFSTS